MQEACTKEARVLISDFVSPYTENVILKYGTLAKHGYEKTSV
jgi:hypothetical protein